MSEPVAEVFVEVTQLWRALRVPPANQHEQCWEYSWGEWRLALNGHDDERRSSWGAPVPAYHLYVEWGGLPVMLLTPRGGTTLGTGDPEGDFIEAVKAECARLEAAGG